MKRLYSAWRGGYDLGDLFGVLGGNHTNDNCL